MSIYNDLYGFNPAVYFFLPTLGVKPTDFPLFRDATAVSGSHPDYGKHIFVLTESGGANREAYSEENQKIREMKHFIKDFDLGRNYVLWIFERPEEFTADFHTLTHCLKSEWPTKLSDAYKTAVLMAYPFVAEQDSNLFGPGTNPLH